MARDRKGRPGALALEDEPIRRTGAAGIVEKGGWKALAAMNARRAVVIPERRAGIRLVFGDIDMPGGMHGMRPADTIRITLAPGYAMPGARSLLQQAVFFPKPRFPG